MKKTYKIILLTLIVVSQTTLVTQAQKRLLIGKWKLNFEKSSFGDIPRSSAFDTFEIKQDKDSLFIIQFEPYAKQTFAINGETIIKSSRLMRTKKTNISWVGNNKMIHSSSFIYELPQSKAHQVSSIDTYSLSRDQNQLIFERLVQISDAKLNWKIKAVYDKL
jgi:hypothetical protein